MKPIAYEATVQNGQIKLPEAVRLPEHTKVYVVVPGIEAISSPYVGSPQLAHPTEAVDFVKEVIEETQDAGLR